MTHSRVFDPPTSAKAAMASVDAWVESPTLQLLHERPDHWPIVSQLIERGGVVGARVHDARIAAICIANRVREPWSADRDFDRFPTLAVRNPLTA